MKKEKKPKSSEAKIADFFFWLGIVIFLVGAWNDFLVWILIIGVVLSAIGIFLYWDDERKRGKNKEVFEETVEEVIDESPEKKDNI